MYICVYIYICIYKYLYTHSCSGSGCLGCLNVYAPYDTQHGCIQYTIHSSYVYKYNPQHTQYILTACISAGVAGGGPQAGGGVAGAASEQSGRASVSAAAPVWGGKGAVKTDDLVEELRRQMWPLTKAALSGEPIIRQPRGLTNMGNLCA